MSESDTFQSTFNRLPLAEQEEVIKRAQEMLATAPASDVPPREEGAIRVIVFADPMNIAGRQIVDVEWSASKTVADYLGDLPDEVEWQVGVSGRMLDRDEWVTTTLPSAEDGLVLVAVPKGNAFRMVALLIVAVIAIVVTAGGAAPILGGMFAAGSIGAGILGATITLVGGMLVNAMLPPPKEKVKDTTSESSPSYGLDGPKPTAQEETPLPIVYGTYRMGGNRINYYSRNLQVADQVTSSSTLGPGGGDIFSQLHNLGAVTDTVGSSQTQELFLQYAVSEGPIESITDLLVNDQPISNYSDIHFDWRAGNTPEVVMPWFNNVILPIADSRTLTTSNIIYNTTEAVDALRFDFICPEGLYEIDPKSGDRGGRSITVEVMARNIVTNASANWNLTLTRSERNPVRFSLETPPLDRGNYQVFIRRTNAQSTSDTQFDKVTMAAINQITLDPVAHNRTATYAVKVRLNEQFNSEPSTTVLVKGRKVWMYDRLGSPASFGWSDNPADIALDILLSSDWGRPISNTRIDFSWFARWRTFCAANNLKFNGAFDTSSNVWDALVEVMRVGRASPVVAGAKWSGVIEGLAHPTMLFGDSNIEKGSFEMFWSGRKGRSNHIEVQFSDENDVYRRNSVFARDDDAIARGETLKQSSINIRGITNPEQAQKEADFQLRLNQGIQLGCRFKSGFDSIGCQIGDVVYVQHSLPKWGWMSRIESVVGNTINIQSEIDSQGGALPDGDWRCLIHFPAIKYGDYQVADVSGNVLRVSGNTGELSRIVHLASGKDYRVVETNKTESDTFYTLDSPYTAGSGSYFEGWGVDKFFEFVINKPAVNGTSITIPAGVPAGLVKDMQVHIGRLEKYKKLFRVVKAEYAADHTRTFECMEYNEWVYTGVGSPPYLNYSELPGRPMQVGNVTASTRSALIPNGAFRYYAAAAWTRPIVDPRGHGGSDVYISINDGPFNLYGQAHNPQETFEIEASVGDTVTFKVVSFDVNGFRAAYNAAPTATVIVGANERKPDPVTSLGAQGGTRQISVTWVLPNDPTVKGVEVNENSTNDLATSYRVEESGLKRSFIQTGILPLRTRYYWVRTVSYSNVVGDWVGPVSATTNLLVVDDLEDGIINTAKFAAGIEPVAIIETGPLPTVRTTATIFHAPTAKIYRWNGSSYTAAVAAPDITGQLDSDQIASVDGSKITGTISELVLPSDLVGIKSVDVLPAQPYLEGRVVYLTTTKKLYRSTGTTWTANIPADDIEGLIGDAKIAALNAEKIIGKIVTGQIADKAITNALLGDAAVQAAQLAANSVTDISIAAGAVSARKLTIKKHLIY